VNETENVVENFGVVRFLLEPHKLDVDHVETFVRFSEKFLEQIVHG
jgi:hypothetical protein